MSQPSKPNLPITPTLARVLAEAADGYRNRGNVYFVAEYQNPPWYNLQGPFPSYDDVPDTLKALIEEQIAGFFGPYDTTAPTPGPLAQLSSIILQFEPEQKVDPVPGDLYDTLFYSISAVEKFALPYYERIYGPDFGNRVRRDFLASELQVMGHLPWSEYADVMALPNTPFVLRRTGEKTWWQPIHPAGDAPPRP